MDVLFLKVKMLYPSAYKSLVPSFIGILIIQFISTLAHANILTGVTDLTFSSQSRYSCAVINHDTAKCWGANWAGQIGDGTTINRLYPVDVFNLQAIQLLTTGGHHTCALLSDHSLKCWGNNGKGQLGDGTNINRLIPTEIAALGNQVIAITAGTSHTCAIVDENNQQVVKCWGDNKQGQLGNNSFINSKIPVKTVDLGINAVAVAAGNEHTCAVLSDGTVKCWGGNGYGQLGNDDLVNKAFPVTANLNNVKNIIAGEAHTCALLTDNTVACWGLNNHGQLGLNDQINRTIPTAVTALSNRVELLSTGSNHLCATISGENSLKCWGANELGQLGIGSTDDALLPTNITLSEKITKISLGYNHSCALTEAEKMYCWGGNGGGQLGDGTTRFRTLPVSVLTTYPDILLKQNENEVSQNSTIDFGTVDLDNSVSQVFTIENTGIDALHLTTPLILDNQSFILTKEPDVFVAGGTSTTFAIKFAPATVGNENSTITINSNDTDENIYIFNIVGIGANASCTPPSTPSQLNATAISPTTVDLTWQDESDNEIGFAIYRDGILLDTVMADIENYHDADLSENTTYYYEIDALNNVCHSSRDYVTVTTPIVPASGGSEEEENEEENDESIDKVTPSNSSHSSSYQLPKELSIFVTLGGSGKGRVISQPKGIDCNNIDGTCRHLFKTGTVIELTPMADQDSTFVGWGGHTDCADSKLFLTGNRLCTAYFRKVVIQTSMIKNTISVYRLWSYHWKKHFHTANVQEKQYLLAYPESWRDENIAFYAFDQTDHPDNTLPVYRFWSPLWESHFYTINEQEKAVLIQEFADEWRYEGIAYYAYPEGQQPVDATPVYRLFSFILGEHFYTASEEEKLMIEQKCSAANWRYEGVGWYVVK